MCIRSLSYLRRALEWSHICPTPLWQASDPKLSPLAVDIDSHWKPSESFEPSPYDLPRNPIMDGQSSQSKQDETSYQVSRQTSGIDGLRHGYTLRRHKYEQNANKGSLRCRDDWRRYIGPIERWGSCNPWDGHFASVVLPLCKHERLALVSYIFECKCFGPHSVWRSLNRELTCIFHLFSCILVR